MICKKRLRNGPTLTITNLVPESNVGVWIKNPCYANQIFYGKACKREGRDIKIQVPAHEEITIRVRKYPLIPWEKIMISGLHDITVVATQQEDNFVFTIHAQDCTGPSKLDRRTAGLRGRTEDIIFYDDRGEDESQSRVISRFPVTYGRTANVVTA